MGYGIARRLPDKPDSFGNGRIEGVIVVLNMVPWWATILRIPFSILGPVIIAICSIGAFTVNSSCFDVVMMMMVFGVQGRLFKKFGYPLSEPVPVLVAGALCGQLRGTRVFKGAAT
jgi:putative tricarboxylic transport membrane protein